MILPLHLFVKIGPIMSSVSLSPTFKLNNENHSKRLVFQFINNPPDPMHLTMKMKLIVRSCVVLFCANNENG